MARKNYIDIPLTKGKFAKVSLEDANLAVHSWYAHESGNNIYAARVVSSPAGKVREWLHKEVMERKTKAPVPRGKIVDHINLDTLDCRRENIRLATLAQNNANKPYSKGVSRYKGVSWSKQRRKWRAIVTFEGKQIQCGFYVDEKDAARAYNEKALEIFGEFVKLNQIEEG